ncbi:hypothetical protein [Pseudorhizobium xiangyangii]|nr:hypothetical protein [Neorhizobium xiangyangii]
MFYEWDEKRARRAYWIRVGVIGLAASAALGASAFLAAALDLGGF